MVHDDLIQCARCAIVFPRPHRTGRRPIYCSHTCRQRAFEARRRAAYHHCLPVLAPRRPSRPHSHLYEAGRTGGIRHALRPDAPPGRDGRRPTLCGTHANITTRNRFGVPGPALGRECRTCARIADRHPLAQPLEPATDLAELKHLLLGAHAPHRTGKDSDALRNTFGLLLATAFGSAPERRTA